MRLHLKNVVHSAVERGVAVGCHRLSKLSKVKRANNDIMVDTILHSIWESLDGIIDFTDDSEGMSEESLSERAIGFSTDAVSDTVIHGKEDEEDEEYRIPLTIIHRLHRMKK